jgi:flagellar biosynthesis/type III secretory pathway chaperone
MARDTLQNLAIEVEGIKKDIKNGELIHSRLDTAIDKLTDVSTSIKQMLAVHEQKIAQTEKTEEILFDKVRERGEELDMVYRDLQRDINQVEKRLLLEMKTLKSCFDGRVSVLEKWRWLIIGGALAIGFIVAKNMPKIINSAGWL